jgi:prepilin-type N-terminal cleavage/methylation domain-containing protein
MQRHSHHSCKGFSLIEMMVAVSIFAIVMMIGVGALLSLMSVNRRAQAVNATMNNLNAAIESMSRAMRVGTTYYCQTSITPPAPSTLASPQDCSSGGGLLFAFESSSGDPADDTDQVVYRINGTQIERSLASGQSGTWVALTAPEITISDFEFLVVGSAPLSSGNMVQPRAVMKIEGSAPLPGGDTTEFSIQASVSQRLLDI